MLAIPHRYNHESKGEALYAMELTLSLERLNFQKLRALHDVADKHGDAEMCDFIGADLFLFHGFRGVWSILSPRWRPIV